MPSCALRYCKNYSNLTGKSQGVTFHRFAKPDFDTRDAWITFVRKNRSEDFWLPSAYTFICSAHFREEDKYVTKTGRIYLKKSAIPCDDPTKSKIIKTEESEPEESEQLPEPVKDSGPTSDNLRIITLETQLQNESTSRKNLLVKLKQTQRQNRHLKKKCAIYKKNVENLKRKLCLNLCPRNDIINKAGFVDPEA